MSGRFSHYSSLGAPRLPVIFLPEGARDEPDLRSLGVGSLRLPGILVPEGGSPPGYPYILLGELHRDDDESDEHLPDEFDSDQVLVPSADTKKNAGSVAPRHLAEQGNKPVAATTGASLAPIGQDSMEPNGAPPPVTVSANSIDANGIMPSSSEAIARAVAIAIAPLDVSGIVDWPGGANWSRVAPNVGSISTDAAGWVDAQRSEKSASRNRQPRVDEAASTSSPSQQGVEMALPNGHPVPDDHSVTGHLKAPVADLSPVATAGREEGETYRSLLNDPETAAGALP